MKVIKSNALCKEIKSNPPVTKVNGFVIPEDQKEYLEVEIINFGDEVTVLSIGDKAYIYPGAGKEVEINGEKYRVINISEIIVVL